MKYTILKYILSFLAIPLLLSSCQEKMVGSFDSESSLFFYRGSENSAGVPQMDSLSYSFFLGGSILTDTVWVEVWLTGIPDGKDRPLPLVQSNAREPGAAVAGEHYVGFDSAELAGYMVMPANSVYTLVPVVVKRTAQMDTQEFRLDMELGTNDIFVAGIMDRTSFTLKITAMAVKPPLWDVPNSYLSIFGPWGQEKMKFIIDYVNYSDFDQVLTTDYRVFLALKAKAALAAYEELHGPLYEADGVTRVVFP